MKIYIVGSLQNTNNIQKFSQKLRNKIPGSIVYDNWISHGPYPDVWFYKYCKKRKFTYKQAMKDIIADSVFETDKKMLQDSDIIIMLQPAGKSACLELAYFGAKGKITLIIKDNGLDYTKVDIMEKFADIICDNLDDFWNNGINEMIKKYNYSLWFKPAYWINLIKNIF